MKPAAPVTNILKPLYPLGNMMQRIKAFAAPHKSYKIDIAQILDVVRITGRDIHHYEPITRNRILQHFRLANLPQTDNAPTRNDEEFFILGVMPVIALCNTGFRNIHRKLTAAGCP